MEVQTDSRTEIFESIADNNYLELQQCVKSIINKEEYVSYNVTKKVFTPDGGSFLGILCEVDIEGVTAAGKKETNIFMKIITPGPGVQISIISLPEAYKSELFVYEELSPIFSKLQNEVKIPTEEKYKFVKSYGESNPNVIILENMSKKDFKTNFRKDVITLQYAEMAIAELAKFHALSFILETKRPKYFERKIKTIKATFSFDEDWDGFVQNMCQITLNYLDEDSRRKLEDFIPSFNEKYRKYLEGNVGRLCLRHGDFRPNNILVKENNGVVSEMIPIDYQLICYGCPILDFIYFIFSSTDQKFRRSHLLHLKELYYNNLRSFLKYFSLDVSSVYPKNDFERDFEDMLDYGLMIGILLIPLLMTSDDNVDITSEPLVGLSVNVDDLCRERLVGIVEDFIEWGYLN
ncbi:hypothetical protein PYW07_014091 [Mythimna separata]|uniref:CHK kinase-like domain-containing protein n=1 Tax=Mythimna separata TaxID=271217 RepID=A0AAD8DQH0_MYTSE|nr:hypothetical protein PYW07_014091 [Mythimna separata]